MMEGSEILGFRGIFWSINNCTALCPDCKHLAGTRPYYRYLIGVISTVSVAIECATPKKKYVSDIATELFATKRCADVTISCGDDKMLAHRCVLSASPVFDKMLESPMTEGTSQQIHVVDFEFTVVKDALELLYTGHASLDAKWDQLLLFVDKYELPSLLLLCISEIEQTLSTDNVVAYIQALNKVEHHEACKLSKRNIMARLQEDVKLMSALVDAV